MRTHAAALVLALGVGLGAGAADSPVAPEWSAIDALVQVDLLNVEKLKQQIIVDLETGAGSENCPKGAWTGRATFLYPDGEELTYFGTGIYCAPIGYGRMQYSDGRIYVGQVNSFLASSSAVLTEKQFHPAVRHGNGKLQAKGSPPMIGRFQRGAFVGDRSQDGNFLRALDAAEASLPDRYAPLITQAVAAFSALPGAGNAVPANVNPFAAKPVVGDSIAEAGAAAVAAKSVPSPMSDAAEAAAAPVAAASSAPVSMLGASSGAASGGGGMVSMLGAGTAAVAASNQSGGGTLALPGPLPDNYRDQVGAFGFPNVPSDIGTTAKQLTKEYEISSRGNGIFIGASCPKAGFLGLKPWRARVVYTKTFSGRIVYDGTGLGCGSIGPGRVEFEDGSIYEGQTTTFLGSVAFPLANFEPAVPQGAGKFTFPDGTSVEGTWVRGELNGGPIVVAKPGQQPAAYVSGTLAQLRASGVIGQGSAATFAGAAPAAGGAPAATGMIAAPAPQGTSKGLFGAMMAPLAGGGSAPAVGMMGSAAQVNAVGASTPFAPAGSAGLPFSPAGAGAVAAVPTEPGKAGPQPMLGSEGKYLCPYTEDGVVAVWVDKAIKARMGGAIGGMVGAEAGKKLFENIPMFGGMFGKMAGDKMGREVAIKMSGGWEYIKANTDQSFDDVNAYVTWLRMNYKGSEHYNEVISAIKEIYPELKVMQF